MSYENMFIEMAIGQDKKILNNINRKSPMVASMPMLECNNGDTNLVEEVVKVGRIPKTDIDAPYTNVTAESDVLSYGMSHFQGMQEVGVGQLKKLNTKPGTYFAKKGIQVFAKSTQDMETTFIYEDIQATAIRNHKAPKTDFTGNRVKDMEGSTADSQYSIQIVTWDNDLTTGLYPENGFGEGGKVFQSNLVSDPQRGTLTMNSDGEKHWVHQMLYNLDVGIQLANPAAVTAICNIENGADLNSIALDYWLSKMIERANAEDGGTLIYMHPELLIDISHTFKNSINQTEFGSGDFKTMLTTWGGVPIMPTRNMLNGTEPVQTGL
ncbi:MAG: hypothetical protein GY774_00335 [Planctomycetes bacterium]|nr:hypothetical protein [Planctomycetota bacterium]